MIGLDSSPEMLAAAEDAYGTDAVTWKQGDIEDWKANQPAALVFANASLQWVGGHDRLFPLLLSDVAPGGLLAIQMPMTAHAPYQDCIRQVIRRPNGASI